MGHRNVSRVTSWPRGVLGRGFRGGVEYNAPWDRGLLLRDRDDTFFFSSLSDKKKLSGTLRMHPVIWLSVCPFFIDTSSSSSVSFSRCSRPPTIHVYSLLFLFLDKSVDLYSFVFLSIWHIPLSLSLSSILLSLSLSFLDSVIPFCSWEHRYFFLLSAN